MKRDIFDRISLGSDQVADREFVGEVQLKPILDALGLDDRLGGIIGVVHCVL
jgi:hypothetical protein